MPAYENLFEMLGDVQSFARETGATIGLADNPRGLRVGFSATTEHGDTRVWEISLPALQRNMQSTPTPLPDRFDFIRENFGSEEARRALAGQLTRGELPWWSTTPVEPMARVTRQRSFSMNETERAAAEAWMQEHEAANWGECIARGPRWSYVFSPHHIITNVAVRCNGCGAEHAVTDASMI
jgi:hypothetical protein